jgi:hypothetical protein
MITGDPRAFGAAPDVASSAPPPSEPSPSSRHRAWLVVGAVAAVALAIALVWPRATRSPLTAATTVPSDTAATEPIITNPSVTTLPGRDAPRAVDDVHLGLSVTPAIAVAGQPVTVRLSGDLTHVSPTMAAIVWIDQQVAPGQFRTIAWIAQVGPGRQLESAVTEDGLSPGPDAIFLRSDQPFGVDVDALPKGRYRMCRYVPVHTSDTSTEPVADTIYICTSLAIGHDSPSTDTPPTT